MGRREHNKASKRARLEAAALEEFRRHGYGGASIESIAAAAGVARGTFYLYFADKRAIFRSLVDRLVDPLLAAADRARGALAGCPDLGATAPIYARLAEEVGALVVHEPVAARVVLAEARAAGPGGDLVRRRIARLEETARGILADGAQRGLFRAHDPGAVALAIVGAIERLAWAALSGDERVAPAALPAEVVVLFRRGLAA
ncbi:MAG TPA: TetR/AcrR family transcriptional regulator [Candidatus Binatia bacterium]|nr:TetR/AcrR family transcriptional regulator [Candidatus Binatia bacterium]